jgi:hypothetical protein
VDDISEMVLRGNRIDVASPQSKNEKLSRHAICSRNRRLSVETVA